MVKNLDHEGVFTGDPLTDDLLDAANYTYSAALLSFVKVSGFKVKKCNVKNQRSVLSYSWATLGKNKIFRCTVETCRQQPIAATANAYIGGTPYSDFMARDELEISYSTFDKLGPFVADYHQDNSSQRSGFRMHHCDVTNYAGIIYKSQSWAYSKESDYAIIEDCYFKPNNALDLSLVGFSFGLLVDDCGSADLIIRNNKFDSFKYGIGRARGPNIRRIQINNNVGTWTNAATVNPCFLVSDSGTDYVGAMELMQAEGNDFTFKSVTAIFATSNLNSGSVEMFKFKTNKIIAENVVGPYQTVVAQPVTYVEYDNNNIEVTVGRTGNFSLFSDTGDCNGKHLL